MVIKVQEKLSNTLKKFQDWKVSLGSTLDTLISKFYLDFDKATEGHSYLFELPFFANLITKISNLDFEEIKRKEIFELDFRDWSKEKRRPFIVDIGSNKTILQEFNLETSLGGYYFGSLDEVPLPRGHQNLELLKETEIFEDSKLCLVQFNCKHFSILKNLENFNIDRCSYKKCRGQFVGSKPIFHYHKELFNLFNHPGTILEPFLYKILESNLNNDFSVEYGVNIMKKSRIWNSTPRSETDLDVVIFTPPRDVKLVILSSISPSSRLNKQIKICEKLKYKNIIVVSTQKLENSKYKFKFGEIHKKKNIENLIIKVKEILSLDSI